MRYLIVTLFIFSSALFASGQHPGSHRDSNPLEGMKTYYLVLLKKGPLRGSHDSATAARIQAEHLAYITRMAEEKKLAMAGPFLDDWEMRGIFIFDVKTKEEATALCEKDPAVKAGRLVFEVHPWLCKPGTTLP